MVLGKIFQAPLMFGEGICLLGFSAGLNGGAQVMAWKPLRESVAFHAGIGGRDQMVEVCCLALCIFMMIFDDL